jgi:hypothetical protein
MRLILLILLSGFGLFRSQNHMTIEQIDNTLKSIDHTVSDNEGENLTFLCKNIYNESKKLNYVEGQLVSLQKLCLYRINAGKEYEQAIADSKTVEELSRSVNDYYFLCLAKMNRSFILLQMGLYKKSDALTQETLKYVDQIKNNDQRHEIYANIYFVKTCYYEIQKDSDKGLHNAEKVYKETKMMTDGFSRKLNWILSSTRILENTYFKMGDYKKAGYYLNLHEKHLKKSKVTLDFALYHVLKAELEFQDKSDKNYLDSSIYHYKEAEKYSKQISNAVVVDAIYSEIANVYAEKKDLRNQALYLDKNKKLKDSINNVQKENFQKINVKTTAGNLNSESDKINKNYIFLSLIPLLGLALFFFFKSKKKAKKTDKSLISISELKNFVDDPDLFDINFQQFFPDFYKNLLNINATLDKSSLHLCAFIKLNFDTKKIATIKKISVRTVENRKYILRKKLNIAAYEDLYIWMSKI